MTQDRNPANDTLNSISNISKCTTGKGVIFLGDSLQQIRQFPEDAKQDMGRQILLIQCGDEPAD